MVAEGHTVASLTGGIEGAQRDAIIDSFRSGEAKVLITTDVLARGIDISTVSLVVNYVSSMACHPTMEINFSSRTSLWYTTTIGPQTFPSTKPTSTVSAVPVALAVLEWPSRLLQANTNGICFTKSKSISTAVLCASIPATGMQWRTLSRRRSRARVQRLNLPSECVKA